MNSPLLSDEDRARIVEELQTQIGALVSAMPETQRALSRALVEAAIAVALWGTDELPADLSAQVQDWWAGHTQSADREIALRVWHAVNAASVDPATIGEQRSRPNQPQQARSRDAFQVAIRDLQDPDKNLTAGTRPVVLGRTKLIRIYYAERRRRSAAGDAVARDQVGVDP